MNVAWPIVIVAGLLLFFPVRFFFPANGLLRTLSHPPDSMEHKPTPLWWLTWAQGLDFLSGWVAAYLLREHGFRAAPRAVGADALAPALVTYGLLLAAVFYRMPVRGRKYVCVAPVGFVLGVMWAVVPPIVALVSTVFLVCSAAAFRSLTPAFLAGAAAVVATGFLFNAPRLELVFFALVAAMPVVVSVVSYRALALPSRR
ncbi:hypothetical protein K0B96_07430 [Horticoccus luteus]|uniref:Uncharacterized protein n=1 Tax=Horticoccus luteus TaxID=2862869 RepID=A0A8F9TY87_9BACT|nr:hypothetical protein [Horticoccus luteus]QYM80428.1 hypothetical protein K0B96_07430 [Horticoccus luteus]